MDKYSFQNCQKIVVFSRSGEEVLLCKRKGEADYDGTFSFIGGKMETSDQSILDGLRREKNEEVGEGFKIRIFTTYSINLFFVKKDGSRMILPHYFAMFEEGEIDLSDEYSEYRWVKVDDLVSFEPKIANIPDTVAKLLAIEPLMKTQESFVI
jgi:ADP-ribose pyrophosphatase YjhB (NUDIX family)